MGGVRFLAQKDNVSIFCDCPRMHGTQGPIRSIFRSPVTLCISIFSCSTQGPQGGASSKQEKKSQKYHCPKWHVFSPKSKFLYQNIRAPLPAMDLHVNSFSSCRYIEAENAQSRETSFILIRHSWRTATNKGWKSQKWQHKEPLKFQCGV